MSLPLFVYGTLKQDEERGPLLAGLPRRPARVLGKLYRMPEGYPAMQPCRPGELFWVHGELVQPPPPHVLRLLDRYEGVEEGLFERVEVRALGALLDVPAWAWVMSAPGNRGGRLLRSGRWSSRWRR